DGRLGLEEGRELGRFGTGGGEGAAGPRLTRRAVEELAIDLRRLGGLAELAIEHGGGGAQRACRPRAVGGVGVGAELGGELLPPPAAAEQVDERAAGDA